MPKRLAAVMAESPFFPEAGFRFLAQLKKNNDREWFKERKAEYEAKVEQPMEALVLALSEACRKQGLPLYAKEKSPVMRVYRDVRFSKNKSPYKTHVSAELRRSFTYSQGLLYVHLSPHECFVASGVYQPERLLLQTWRDTVVKDPARFQKLTKALEKQGLQLSSEHTLTKLPRGFQNYADEPFAPALKFTSFVVSRSFEAAECTKPDFLGKLVDFALAARPLMEFAWDVETAFAKTKPKVMREEELV